MLRPLVLVGVFFACFVMVGCASDAGAPERTENRDATAAPQVGSGSAIVLRAGDGSRRVVALTFETGVDAGRTANIIETLRVAGVRATFALTGCWAETHPALMRAIAADGHQIINSGYAYSSFTGASTGTGVLTPEQRALELSRGETSIYRATNRSTRPYARPPYGDVDASVERDLGALGYSVIVLWSIDTRDAAPPDADGVAAHVRSSAAPGAIVRLHTSANAPDAEALPEIIRVLRADGYGFEPVAEMAGP